MASTVLIKVLGDSRDAQKAFADVERSAQSLSDKMKSTGESLSSAGRSLTAGVTLPIVAMGALAINSASNLEDALGATSAVFGLLSDSVVAWSQTTTNAFGISQQDALTYVSTLGNVLQAQGMNKDASAALSQQLVGLSADFASFTGSSPETAFEALLAAQTGEYEQLKKYGIVLTEDRVKRKAQEMGIWDGKGAMDAMTKATAANALIMEDSKNMQGDYQRTADGTNNSLNTAKARFEDLTAQIGQALLPVVNWALDLFGRLTDWFTNLDPNIQKVILVVVGLAAALGPVLMIVGGLITAIGALVPVIAALFSPVTLVIAAIVALAAGLWWLYNNNETFRNAVQAVWEWIKNTIVSVVSTIVGWFQENWPKMKQAAMDAWQWIQDNVVPVIQTIADFISKTIGDLVAWAQETWPKFQEAVTHVWNAIYMVVSAVVTQIQNIVSFVWNFITMITQGWGDNLKNIIMAAWDFIKMIVTNAINVIKQVIEFVINIINGDWGAAWDNIKNIVMTVLNTIWGTVQFVWALIVNVIGAAIDTVKNVVSAGWGFISGIISNVMGGIWGTITSIWNSIIGFFQGIPGTISSIASGMWNGLLESFKSVVNGIIGAWNRIDFGIHVSIPDWVPGVGGRGLDIDDIFPDIPMLAKGGDIARAGTVLVGEAGPELLSLPTGARVTPLRGRTAVDVLPWEAAMSGGGTTNNITINAEMNADPVTIAREIVTKLKIHGG